MNAAEVLKTYFGYDSFRKGQKEIVDSILSGRDALAIMPTGAGKSLCYQVPAMLLPGVTLVISPLISLMQDQVKSLNEAGIHAAFINSSLTETQISKALGLALRGTYKIIYVAPERLESGAFLQFALQGQISMVTVDEAHCISQWGQDFRPGYLKIVDFIERLPRRPVVSAFTATATEEVKEDIACVLKLENPNVVVTGFDRENLYYRVEHLSGKQKDGFVADYIEKHPDESGIIYCATRKNVDSLYEALFKRGVPVTGYHAGMDGGVRKKNQEDFIYDRTPVIVATNAFGMGIDKSNVRFVIHYNMPQSMENYYQEAGRAGRDGERAQCILLFSSQDVMINRLLLDNKGLAGEEENAELIRQRDLRRLRVMEDYCRTTSCLRNYILEYFGERTGTPCDNCGNCHRKFSEVDMTADGKWVINCLAETKGRFGQNIVVGTLLGANRARLREVGATDYRSYGALSGRTEDEIRLLIDQMVAEGYVVRTEGEYSVLKMGDFTRLRGEDTRIVVQKAEREESFAGHKKSKPGSTDSFTSAGFRLFEALKKLRLVIAREEAVPPYVIFSDKTLIDMCRRLPGNERELLAVSGVGRNKLEKYGQRFHGEIADFFEENPGVVTSEDTEAGEIGEVPERKRREQKEDFYLKPEDAEEFEYTDHCSVSEFRNRLNGVCSAENVKKLSYPAINAWLAQNGLVREEEREGRSVKLPTAQGLEAGIRVVDRVSQKGVPYQQLLYSREVQKRLLEAFVRPDRDGGTELARTDAGSVQKDFGGTEPARTDVEGAQNGATAGREDFE